MWLCCEITVPEMIKHGSSSEKDSKTLDVVGRVQIPALPIVPSHPINDSATNLLLRILMF